MIDKYLKNKDWIKVLDPEFKKDYFLELSRFITDEYSKKTIYPPMKNIFEAFNKTSIQNVKAVIIGQDPYHGAGQAHGLCFSVLPPNKIPPSLKNIFKEISSDLEIEINSNGNLNFWAERGVLMLNSILTVESGKPMSHQKKGWETFTNKIIEILNSKEKIVFMAWGSPAHEKIANIDSTKHLVLKSVHPSPLAAYRGFLGCRHFSKCNEYLLSHGINPIDWRLN